jgi:hypothetical protein
MNLRDTILSGHSKAICSSIVDWIGNNQSRYDELVQLFLHDKYKVVQRAAWPLSEAVRLHPHLIQQHVGAILAYLQQPGLHEAVKRNSIRLLQYIIIPEVYHGIIMHQCFGFLVSPAEKPAIKAYSLTVLQNFCKQYPEIMQELKTIIEDRWEFETPAFHARAKKILKEMDPGQQNSSSVY